MTFENVKKEIEAFGEYAIEVIPAGRPEIKDYVSTIGRMLDTAKSEIEAELSRLRERNKSIEEQHERIVEKLRQETDAASEQLDAILKHAPHHKTIPGADNVERVKNALERYSDLVSVLEDHAGFTSADLLGSFDLKLPEIEETFSDYAKTLDALNDREGAPDIDRGGVHEQVKGLIYDGFKTADERALAVDVVKAASEFLRDLDWERPNPTPLSALREAVRAYSQANDDVAMPRLIVGD